MKGGSSTQKSLSESSEAPTQGGAPSTSEEAVVTTDIDATIGGKFVSAGNTRKQRRVNCRVEARERGLKGKEKRQFRRNCRKMGGYDDGLDM
mgnify:CR=1 FL=1